MIELIAGATIPAALVSWLALFVVRRKAGTWGLVDRPGHRKVHEHPTPLGGGLGIWLGVVATIAAGQVALWLVDVPATGRHTVLGIELPERAATHLGGLKQQASRLWGLVAAGTVMMALGLADDRRALDWRLRLSVQFGLAALLVFGGGWRLTMFLDAPLLTGLLSVFWIVGLINSFNMLDNMDGLSGGVAAISSAMLAAVMLLTPEPATNHPQLFVAGFLLLLVGSLAGFLFHNRPPARIFMGDAGAYFIGFWIAMGTMMATFSGGALPRHAILAPLCVLAVPLYDTATVVLIRLRSGLSPFVGDKNHFSHRLVELGLSKTQAVLTIYLTTATTGLGALLLHQVDFGGAIVIVLLVACVLVLIGVLETSARRKLRREQAEAARRSKTGVVTTS
ncbi:MAG: undecaprenyl/decaprenyl-phosphate alpha-N-acetylglucosaminyl 1-phosphate transferase [Pirellulales bacterium]|nr:undecaprenyl/decaprenyl-phosphate alpha-N-acetylglucosaminyl 1-phosphate transferase [Pirellulales bacterium]